MITSPEKALESYNERFESFIKNSVRKIDSCLNTSFDPVKGFCEVQIFCDVELHKNTVVRLTSMYETVGWTVVVIGHRGTKIVEDGPARLEFKFSVKQQ
jgi:hypothetical protein